VYYRDTTLLLCGCALVASEFNFTNAAKPRAEHEQDDDAVSDLDGARIHGLLSERASAGKGSG